MKTFLITVLISTIGLVGCKAQNQGNMEEEKIKSVVLSVEKAAAERDIDTLEKHLHKDYRVMANRFKGTKNTTILTREIYFGMMKSEKIGGTTYKTEFKNINITNHTATVEVLFKSDETPNMHKYLFMVQNENDKWEIISDLPIIL